MRGVSLALSSDEVGAFFAKVLAFRGWLKQQSYIIVYKI
jgi:hypothetical protein